jgi:hypothetical protein
VCVTNNISSATTNNILFICLDFDHINDEWKNKLSFFDKINEKNFLNLDIFFSTIWKFKNTSIIFFFMKRNLDNQLFFFFSVVVFRRFSLFS